MFVAAVIYPLWISYDEFDLKPEVYPVDSGSGVLLACSVYSL